MIFSMFTSQVLLRSILLSFFNHFSLHIYSCSAFYMLHIIGFILHSFILMPIIGSRNVQSYKCFKSFTEICDLKKCVRQTATFSENRNRKQIAYFSRKFKRISQPGDVSEQVCVSEIIACPVEIR